ncbi:MAG TPA: PQQ-binding-like beta-propeller repeat protein [bacterium]|nr:PQQ-binding-like beta-propeller repeat protein [bacterium]
MHKTRTLLATALALVLAAGPACKKNHPPDVPAVPTGPQFCFADSVGTFKTAAVDPDGDSVAIRFDWGDSKTSFWSDWVASGETVAQSHSWSDSGTFKVRAWAMDKGQLTSDLSSASLIQIALRRPPNAPAKPAGPRRAVQNTPDTFTTVAIHPDSLNVAVRFAWGDGDTSAWSSFVASGESVRMSHAWSTANIYAVTAQAKDTGNARSLWSVPCSIDVRPPDTLRKWRYYVGAGDGTYPASSPAIAADGTIYVGSLDSSLYAVNADGTLKWRYKTGGKVRASPAIAADGTVYVGSYDSSLYALSSDGSRKWRIISSHRITGAPAIAAGGTIYFGTWQGNFYAVNADGSLRWFHATGGNVYGSPVVAEDGTVYVGAGGVLFAFNPDSTVKWTHTTSGEFRSAPAIDTDGAVYIGSTDGALYAVNPDSTLKWQHQTGGSVLSAPAIGTGGTIYVGSLNDSFYAFNADGSRKWQYPTGGPVYSGPAIAADGTVYFGSGDSCLYALNSNGTLKWQYQADGMVQSAPTIGADGTVYFTCEDGYLYALKGTSPLATSPWPKFHHDLRNTGSINAVGWKHLVMIGQAQHVSDSSGFTFNIGNDGTVEDTINWLEMAAITPDSAYLRDFQIAGNEGIGFPLPGGTSGKGAGDTLYFAPVTIAPGLTQQIHLVLLDFHVSPVGTSAKASVVGKSFQFRFSDGSTITTAVPAPFLSRGRPAPRRSQ